MKATLTGRTLSLDIYDLAEDLDDEARKTLADALAVRDDVIKYVAQQIVGEWTDLESRGARDCTADASPQTGLDWAVREVSKRAGEVASAEIKRLERALAYHEKQHKEMVKALHDVQNGFRT